MNLNHKIPFHSPSISICFAQLFIFVLIKNLFDVQISIIIFNDPACVT